jgi:hypothetical protein
MELTEMQISLLDDGDPYATSLAPSNPGLAGTSRGLAGD